MNSSFYKILIIVYLVPSLVKSEHSLDIPESKHSLDIPESEHSLDIPESEHSLDIPESSDLVEVNGSHRRLLNTNMKEMMQDSMTCFQSTSIQTCSAHERDVGGKKTPICKWNDSREICMVLENHNAHHGGKTRPPHYGDNKLKKKPVLKLNIFGAMAQVAFAVGMMGLEKQIGRRRLREDMSSFEHDFINENFLPEASPQRRTKL